MRIIPIINHLKTNVALLNSRVEQAHSLQALSDDEINNDLPICIVHTLQEKAHENETIGSVDQQLPKQFNLMYASDNIDIDTNSEPLEDLRAQVFAAILGFQPDADHGPIEFVQGGILATSKKIVWWVDTFKTETMLCDTP